MGKEVERQTTVFALRYVMAHLFTPLVLLLRPIASSFPGGHIFLPHDLGVSCMAFEAMTL